MFDHKHQPVTAVRLHACGLLAAMLSVSVLASDVSAQIWTDLTGGLSVNNIQLNLQVNTISNIPIGGYQPLVVTSLTNEDTTDDLDFFAYNTDTYLSNGISGAHALASNGSPYYQVALLDTGAQVHLLTQEAIAGFDFAGNNLLGSTQFSVGGAGGSELVTIHDPLGLYVTSLGNATGGTSLSVATNTLVGQYNVTVVGAEEPESILPDVVGLPLASQYTTVIRADQRYEVVVGSQTYESPSVELYSFGDSSIPDYTMYAPLSLLPGSAFASSPFFFPGFDNLEDFHDNPSLPSSVAGALFLTGNLANAGENMEGIDMFLDTGAQVTVISELTAATLGIDVVQDEPAFTIEIQGAGGVVQDVPGFYLDSFELVTIGGDFILYDVPVIVLNVLDPRDGVNPVPAIVGTNLFSDRNIVINPEAGNAYLAISDIVTILGDLNSDGFVGLDDLDIILNHWNQDVTEGYLLSGDPSGDGFVGLDDLDIVLSNWNAGTPPTVAVPEPGTCLILVGTGLLTLRRRAA